MKANTKFTNKPSSFWAYAKLLSEQLGYSSGGKVLYYSYDQAHSKLQSLNIHINEQLLNEVIEYLEFRANELNEHKKYLMDVEQARVNFKKTQKIYLEKGFTSSQPFNKQKNEKKDYAYFTCMINTITEERIRSFCNRKGLTYGVDLSFNDNPKNLSYLTDHNRNLVGIMSRRYDGAFPSIVNPILIWEIKEYYYTTTFGSRIADGVYETQLDGYEIKNIREETDLNVYHIYFIDDYNTWWNMGKSYLCRIVDMLHMGLVDEVLFGKEIFTEWPNTLDSILNNNY